MNFVYFRSAALICVALILITIIPLPADGTSRDVSKSIDRTAVVGYMDYDEYIIDADDRKFTVEVEVSSGGDLDFYLLTEEQAKYYRAPITKTFGYIDKEENARSVGWDDEDVVRVLIVDNDIKSASGAFPVDNVTYTIKIKIEDYDFFYRNFCLSVNGICAILFILAVVTTGWLYYVPKKYREQARRLSKKYP